jgi:RND family efflux transporter MFP subunit
MSLRFPFRTLAFAALLALAAVLAACSGEKQETAAAPETVRGLSLLTLQPATVPDWTEAVGTVQAAQTATLSAQVVAEVREVRVREGDHVRRGQVLVVLDDAHLRSGMQQASAGAQSSTQEIAAADADYALAQATLQRYRNLYQRHSVSPQEFDEVQARYKAAEAHRAMAHSGQAQASAALSGAETMLAYTRVRAPFDGVVTARLVDPGALASPGVPLVTVEDVRHFRLDASVDESEITAVQPGAAVPVTLDALAGETLQGKVRQIVPVADPAARSFLVKIELPADARLRSGLFGRARFARGQRQALLVPAQAVVKRGQLQAVYIVDSEKIAALRYVVLGRPQDGQVEVLSGLNPGDRVIAQPGDRDLAGRRVEASGS